MVSKFKGPIKHEMGKKYDPYIKIDTDRSNRVAFRETLHGEGERESERASARRIKRGAAGTWTRANVAKNNSTKGPGERQRYI